MEERETRLLVALVQMVSQYLDHHKDGLVDTMCMSAGEHAACALAEYGLMEVLPDKRFARWTEAGHKLWDVS